MYNKKVPITFMCNKRQMKIIVGVTGDCDFGSDCDFESD